MQTEEFLVFGQPEFGPEEEAEVIDSLRKAWLGTGPKVAKFEQEFAKYKGVEHVAGLFSCTAALHLSCLALDLEPGSEVITTPMSFCATVNGMIHAGLKPVLADVDAKTQNIDPKLIREKITPRTRAILPVHFAGRACDMDAIMKIASEYNLKVIEDCAHAIETEYHGKKAGTFGDFSAFSFYATKNLAMGEGGLVISKDAEKIKKIKISALHGMSLDAWKRFSDAGYKHYDVVEAGFKYNMMDLQAGIGLHQLRKLEKNWLRRKEIWQIYMEEFKNLPIDLPAPDEPNTRHAYHLFTVQLNSQSGMSRDTFLDEMNKKRLGVGVHYRAIPEHPIYKKMFGWNPEETPISTKIGRGTVSLPLSPKLTPNDVERVVKAVKSIILKK